MMTLDLAPQATAAHWSARYVGQLWSEHFNCWRLVQDVQRHVFSVRLPDLPVGTTDDQTAAILVVTQGWRRVHGDVLQVAAEGDVITMLCDIGPHVGVMVGRDHVLHNVGGKRDDGVVWGCVRIDDVAELGRLSYGHLRLWRLAR